MPYKLIPEPKKVQMFEGEVGFLSSVHTENTEWDLYIDAFADSIYKIFDIKLVKKSGGIEVIYDASVEKEHYIIDSRDGVKIYSSCNSGVTYALSTLLQLLKCSENQLCINRVYIEDFADKSYRALMVDLARKWHPVKNVLKYIDVCYFAKLPYIHLHFIDDQSYTLPSNKFPDINNGCRHYSYDDIKDICDYAKARGITIIPEFETPGHAGFLVKNYPDIFSNVIDNADNAVLVTENGDVIKANNIVCAGSYKSFDGIKLLISEICEMFPDSPYIHIGGDEANIDAWNYCDCCKGYMKDNEIADVHELYSDFVARVAKLVLDMDRTPIVWEGFSKAGCYRIPRETIVIAWESYYNMSYDLLDAGFKIINASWQPLYIVPSPKHRWGASEIMDWNVYNWQHWWPKSQAKLNPITVQPTDNVLGAQICAWESTFDCCINFVMENTAALSERLWNTHRTITTEEFLSKLRQYKNTLSMLIADK